MRFPTRDECDPWAEVEDIDGVGHYRTLGIAVQATQLEIKQAFRDLARKHHPDKGGDAGAFQALREAFEVLSDEDSRRTYDTWAKELKYRHLGGQAPRAEGCEDHLFDEFDRQGIHCDAATQLVVTCEVCGRPSLWECWTCKMPCCDFCALKPHWWGKFPLHWPVKDNPGGMQLQLAKKELEAKRLEDARRAMLELPNYRTDEDLQVIREFRQAAQDVLTSPQRKVTYDLRIARFYAWAQTARHVYIAVFVPTGYEDKELHLDISEGSFRLQAEGSPPIVDRLLDDHVATDRPVETFRSQDNRVFTAALPKARAGGVWARLFRGDPDGARCLQPLYSMAEGDDDIVLEFELPFWVEAGDVSVRLTERGVDVRVRNQLDFRRSFWQSGDPGSRRPLIDPPECAWCLDDEESTATGEACKVLMLTLVKPPLNDEERRWKKGVRMDHRAADRRDGPMGRKGYRLFADDEDTFGLEDILQAACFMDAGAAYVRAKPWEGRADPGVVRDVAGLPRAVQAVLAGLLKR